MKILGENLFYCIIRSIYRYFGERKFVREVIANKEFELSYEQVKGIWNNEFVSVHGDMSKSQYYFMCIDEVLKFELIDNVVDIGCGDGTIDSYIQVKKLYGIDISHTKLKEAKKRNPNYLFFEQSFLDTIAIPETNSINKVFSYGVFQYCKPEDIEKIIQNSIDIILNSEFDMKEKIIIAHLEIPDIEKAYLYYQNVFGISERRFIKYKEHIRTIFGDGSYWHDLNEIKAMCERYICKGGGKKAIVYVTNSHCYYRSNLIIHIY